MKHLMIPMAILMVGVSGCNSEDPEAVHKISLVLVKNAAKAGTLIGLKTWAKTSPDAAIEASTALSKNIREVLIPYLNKEGQLLASSEIRAFVNSSLFDKVNPVLKEALVDASLILDSLLPVPSAEKLSPKSVELLLAFVTGAADGCDSFLNSKSEVRGPSSTWIQ